MRNIQTVAQLHDLQNETYVYAAIVVIAIFGVSFLLAQLTPYKGGNDRSYITRRIWWFISMAVGSLGFWLYNQLYVMPFIKKVAFQSQFSTTNMICLGVTLVGSAILSLIVMFCFLHTKFGSILGKQRQG